MTFGRSQYGLSGGSGSSLNVERGAAQAPVAECLGDRLVVDKPAATHVDEIGAGFDMAYLARPDESMGRRRQRRGEHDHVALRG